MKKLATAPSGSRCQSDKVDGQKHRLTLSGLGANLLVTVLWTLRLTGGGEMEGSLSSSFAAVRCRLEEDIVHACRRSRSGKWSWPTLLGRFQPIRFTRWKHFRLMVNCIDGRTLHGGKAGLLQLNALLGQRV